MWCPTLAAVWCRSIVFWWVRIQSLSGNKNWKWSQMSWDTILSVQKCTQRFYKICKEIQMLLFLQLIITVLYPPQASTSFHFVSSASSSIFPDGFLVSLPQTQDHWFCMGKQNVHKGLNTWTIFAPFFWIQPTGGASYMFIEQGVGTLLGISVCKRIHFGLYFGLCIIIGIE